jgi:transcriptional regulator with XRE-family HTH domain
MSLHEASAETLALEWETLMRYCGRQIRLARHAQHLSQRAFATQAGISQGDLSLIEQGKITPGHARLHHLACLLGLPYAALWPPLPPTSLVLVDPDSPLYHLVRTLQERPDGLRWAEYLTEWFRVLCTTSACLRDVPPPSLPG